MRDLLLLAHRLPYPPNKGDKIRSFHWVKHLRSEYRIHLGTFVDAEEDLGHIPALQTMCADTYIARLRPRLASARSLVGFLKGQPLTVPYYTHRGMAAWVRTTLKRRVDAILVFSATMAQYLPPGISRTTRWVCDFVDVDSDKWRQYATETSPPMRWIYAREAARLLSLERSIAAEANVSLFVSRTEANLFRRLAPEVAERVTHVDNGVDADYFSPSREYPDPYEKDIAPVVFVGAMDYRPNVDAVVWFADEVLPRLTDTAPMVRFFIVGTRPDETVRRLAQRPRVKVTGAVEDVRPYLAHARVVVAPLRIARGIQNKVLEAMAMAKTLVVTPQGLDGIDATPGSELLLAQTAEELAGQVLVALSSGRQGSMGAAARSRVERDYSWSKNADRLLALLSGDAVLEK